MSGSTARLQAIAAVTNYKPISPPMNFAETPSGELYGSNVFGLAEMAKRLPKPVFKSLKRTIERGEKLDATSADIVAEAMKAWAIEKGATHYAPRLLPPHRPHRRKARLLSFARRPWRRDPRVLRQGADPRGARRLELSLRRHPGHVRGPRLHRLGRDQPGLHPRKPERHDALHPHRVRLLDRRGAR